MTISTWGDLSNLERPHLDAAPRAERSLGCSPRPSMYHVSTLRLVLYYCMVLQTRGPSRITQSNPPIREGTLSLREGERFV